MANQTTIPCFITGVTVTTNPSSSSGYLYSFSVNVVSSDPAVSFVGSLEFTSDRDTYEQFHDKHIHDKLGMTLTITTEE